MKPFWQKGTKRHNLIAELMPLVPTIIRCCAHIVRLVCRQMDRRTDKPSAVTLAVHVPRVNKLRMRTSNNKNAYTYHYTSVT